MIINTQHLMRIAAILALTAASTSTFAQSNEYRRGYQDGFAAAQRASSDERGAYHDRRDWRVHIEKAGYGAEGAMCDARAAVHDQVERNNGAVHAGNELCGDPAVGAQKRLWVVYRCGDSEPQRAIAREHETLRLSCRR